MELISFPMVPHCCEAGAFGAVSRAITWYPLDAAVVEPGIRALQEMTDLGPEVRDGALEAGGWRWGHGQDFMWRVGSSH